jgi:hypothetical protein
MQGDASRLQHDTIANLWGVSPNRSPVDTHHGAVHAHTVRGHRILSVDNRFMIGSVVLKYAESDNT